MKKCLLIATFRVPLLQSRQTSDQYSHDGGHYGAPQNPADDGFGDLFAPAEHADSLKRRKDIKRKERKEKTVENPAMSHTTPRMKNSKKGVSTPPGTSGSSVRSRTPPTTQSTDRPPKSRENYVVEEEEDVWYAKWWMFCFPDVQTMTPKR